MALPPPPDKLATRVVTDSWPAGARIHRAHPHLFGSAQMDERPDADSRFSTIRSPDTVIPVLYGGESHRSAASETIFHTVDAPGGAARPRRVSVSKFRSWQWSEVVTSRTLQLVRFDGVGLERLGVSRQDLIESDRRSYPLTRTWGQDIAVTCPEIDGLWWMSRQDPAQWAVVLFGHVGGREGGVRAGDLVADGPALPFALPQGLDLLDQLGIDLGVTVVRP